MTYDELEKLVSGLSGVTYVCQWGGSHVWKVGGKVFVIGGWTGKDKPAYTFKVSEQNFHFLRENDGYRPAPYLASRGMSWIQQFDSTPERDEELTYYIMESYRLVSLNLTKKKQKELGLNQPSESR